MKPSHLLVVEDAHWLDPISRSILSDLVTLPGASLLLTSRELQPLLTPIGPEGRFAVTLLTAADIVDMCSLALPGVQHTESIARIIFHKSDGNPLFAAELLRQLAAGSALPIATDAASNLAGTIGSI